MLHLHDIPMSREEQRTRRIIAHVLLWGRGTYAAPEDWADALLQRLDHEGYRIVPKSEEDSHAPPVRA